MLSFPDAVSLHELRREFAAGIKIRAEEMGSGLRLSTNRDELTRRADDVGFETHLTVDVPPVSV